MDNSVPATSTAFSEQSISVDVNDDISSISDETNVELKALGTSKHSYVFLLLFLWKTQFLLLSVRDSYFWSILNFITKPVAVFSIFATIAIPIGIIIVYFTSPKQPGMFFSFFFYILISTFEIYL